MPAPDAYKHLHVRESDIPLQIVEWGGCYFVDRSVTFGMASSPGLYTDVSGAVKEIARADSKTRAKNLFQVLDDCGHLGSEKDTDAFYQSYKRIGLSLGVKLAEGEDKSFPASRKGVVLGLEYDSTSWTTGFPLSKWTKMLDMVLDVIESETIESKFIEVLSGKLEHYKDVISPQGRWERGFILKETGGDGKPAKGRVRLQPRTVKVTPELRQQCQWWARNLWLLRERKVSIPDPRPWFPMNFVALYPDAAGGSDTSVGNGMGGVVWNEERPMVYSAWPQHIQTNRKDENGVKFARKLSMLEGVAALGTLSANADILRGKAVKILTDNKGLALAFNKAHSRDLFTYSVMLALKDVARYLGIKLAVVWTARCSSGAEEVADHLSKARFKEAGEVAGVPVVLKPIPLTLLNWLLRPRVTRLLGYAMLEEISMSVPVLPREPEDRSEIASLLRVRQQPHREWKEIV